MAAGSRYHLLNDGLVDKLSGLSRDEQGYWLFLSPSEDFRGRWSVDSLQPDFFFDFEEIIGHYRTVSPAGLDQFLTYSEESGYHVVFTDPPEDILHAYEHLHDLPPFSLNSSLEGTRNGMLPWQIAGFNKLIKDEDLNSGCVVWDTGPQPLDAKILTPTGWTTMEELKIGQEIVGYDGCGYRISGVFPQGEQEVFRLTFKDGSQAYSTANHLWGFWDHVGNYYVRRLDEYMAAGLFHKRGDAKWFVDRILPVQYEISSPLPIDPYLLGVILGDGSLTNSVPQIYSHEGEIVPFIEECLPEKIRVSQYGPKHFALVSEEKGRNNLTQKLKDLGLWRHTAETKFIPESYKRASEQDRLALLQGLLDTDGSAEGQSARLFTVSDQLAEDVEDLVRGLGGRAKISYRAPRESIIRGQRYDCKEGWVVNLSLPPRMEYFRLPRKQVLNRPEIGKNSLRSITSVGVQPVQCISVNSPDNRYVTQDYILTHNTGKTAFVASAILWHLNYGHPFDLGFVVVKSNNKRDMQKKLKSLADIESVVIDGTPKKRWGIYESIQDNLLSGQKVVAVTNYEKFREDDEFFKVVIEDRDTLFFWDEMPTRLSNRNTILYKAVKGCLWERFTSKAKGLEGAKPRASWMRQWELSATPIENSPEGQFNCIRLMNPPLLGRVEEFEGEYCAYKNPFSHKPEKWVNLDKLEPRLEHMTHRVSRNDPEVAQYFPKVVEDSLLIDWNPTQRRVYDVLTGKAKEMIEADFDDTCVLSLIQVMQMVCDAPSMIVESAKNRSAFERLLSEFEDDLEGLPALTGPKGSEVAMALLETLPKEPTNKGHTKLETLREILLDKHPDEKALVFMTWASYGIKPLTAALDEWDVTYVTYEGTQKQADEAKDRFREDPDIRVFLSSDRGADSIDLPEAAVGVNYNLPWTWVRKRQRMRNVRADSQLSYNYWYDLIMADSIEERKQEIIDTKHGYHKALYDGAAFEESMSAKLTRDDLLYILIG